MTRLGNIGGQLETRFVRSHPYKRPTPNAEAHIAPSFTVTPDQGDGPTVREPSILHRRSVEYEHGFFELYGQLFMTGTKKGARDDQPIRAVKSELGEIVFLGLLHTTKNDDSLVRIIRASEALADIGVQTERILDIKTRDQFYYRGQLIGRKLLERKLREQVYADMDLPDEPDEGWGFKRIRKADLKEFEDDITTATFFQLDRAQQTSERIMDLAALENYEDLEELLTNAYTFLNEEEHRKAASNTAYTPTYLDIPIYDPVTNTLAINQEQFFQYLTNILPTRAAKNIALMHKNGISHGFLHAGNISTVGSVYDLDTAKGALLGLGDVSAEEDFTLDVQAILSNDTNGVTKVIEIMESNNIIPQDMQAMKHFRRNFLREYYKTRWNIILPEDTENPSLVLGRLTEITESLSIGNREINQMVEQEILLPLLLEGLHWGNFSSVFSYEQLVYDFLQKARGETREKFLSPKTDADLPEQPVLEFLRYAEESIEIEILHTFAEQLKQRKADAGVINILELIGMLARRELERILPTDTQTAVPEFHARYDAMVAEVLQDLISRFQDQL